MKKIILPRNGMAGQPQPSPDTVVRLRGAIRQFLIRGGDLGKARPDLILLVEREPGADLTDYLAPALTDQVAYQGLTDTLIEAIEKESDETKKNYLLYNLARIHLLKARTIANSIQRRPFADAAARAVGQIPSTVRDNAVYELRGDIELERGDMNAALAHYGRIGGTNSTALSQYKIGLAYLKNSRYREAEGAFTEALKADARSPRGQGQVYHYTWQAVGILYLAQRKETEAVKCLDRSLKIKATEAGQFRFLTDLARSLLRMGQRQPVAEYAANALKMTPEDPELTVLQADAQG